MKISIRRYNKSDAKPLHEPISARLYISSLLFFSAIICNTPIFAGKLIYADTDEVIEFYQQGKIIFNTSMPNDGSGHYFTDSNPQTRENNSPTAIWMRDSAGAKEIATVGLNIPADVHISPDNKTLYVTEYGAEQSFISSMQRNSDGWTKPQKVARLQMPKGAGYPTSTNDGKIYFSSDGDIYVNDGQNNSKLPDTINSEEGEHDPFIAQDESFLIVVRQVVDIGDSNMFISLNQNGIWSKLIKLPEPYNLDKVDGSPYVTPDKKYLFFTSNRHGEGLRTYQAPFKLFYEQLSKKMANNIPSTNKS